MVLHELVSEEGEERRPNIPVDGDEHEDLHDAHDFMSDFSSINETNKDAND